MKKKCLNGKNKCVMLGACGICLMRGVDYWAFLGEGIGV